VVFSRKIEPAPDFFDALAVELAYCHEKPTKVSSTNKVVLVSTTYSITFMPPPTTAPTIAQVLEEIIVCHILTSQMFLSIIMLSD